MKVLYQILVCCAIIVSTFVLKKHPADKPKINNEWITFESANQKSAINLLQDKTALKLSVNDEMHLLSSKNDALGYRHFRFQQTYKDVPIEGAVYLMHEKNNQVKNANGKLVRNLNLNTTPAICKSEALEIALSHVDATLYAWNHPMYENLKKQIENCIDATFYPAGELVIIDLGFGIEAANYRLAYKFDIYSVEPLKRSWAYIDAQNGQYLSTMEKIQSCIFKVDSETSNSSNNTIFKTCEANHNHSLQNNTKEHFKLPQTNDTAIFAQNSFSNNDQLFTNDPVANKVHWATQKTFEYFWKVHQRNGLDGEGMPLYNWVHYDENFNNAFWNGHWISYGDGDNTTFSSFTSPDAVAHEIAHGITDFSADLIRLNESGVLNESFSDIFAEIAEHYMQGKNDWLLGADFTLGLRKSGLRNMRMPKDPNALIQQPDTYLGDFWYTGSGDNGGVHYNSGVQNYWFYLLAEGGYGINDRGKTYKVKAIGMEKAANIVYRNLTVYLTPTSQYTDARKGAIQSAIDLYGVNSNEVQQVKAAWCAVGVGTCGFWPFNFLASL